jgi:class 3 adenylate cyclase
VSPFALGWAYSLARRGVPSTVSARELFNRQILIGIAFTLAGIALVTSVPHLVTRNVTGLVSVLLIVSMMSTLMWRFIGKHHRLAPSAHAVVGVLFASPALSSIAFERHDAFVNYSFALPCPVLATLLTGVWGGLAWTLILVADLLLIYEGPRLGLPLQAGLDLSGYLAPGSLTTFLSLETGMFLLFVTWFVQQRKIVEGLLSEEREKARLLLRATVPSPIADRLEAGDSIADALDDVTVLFADLVGFTSLSSRVTASEIVTMLSQIFAELDRIAEEEGVEKIKTIGDCYMGVVGAPTPCDDHADRALRFCLRVQQVMQGRRYLDRVLCLRIGVHSGPVVAGILGRKRMLYDVWGDTVNTASRIESSGLPGEVQLSEETYKRCRRSWRVEDRGVVALRGREGVRCYLLRGERAHEEPPDHAAELRSER